MSNADLALLNFVVCAGGLVVLAYAAVIGWLYDLRDLQRQDQSLGAQSVLITLGIALVYWLVAWLVLA